MANTSYPTKYWSDCATWRTTIQQSEESGFYQMALEEIWTR